MKLTHPDSKQTIDVDPAHVAAYESQGWERKAPAKSKTTTKESS